MTEDSTASPQQFADDVRSGLTAHSKHIPCVWFYDDRGSRLFEEICQQPEYYPTRAEAEILQTNSEEIANLYDDKVVLVELGSGSSSKTRYLIEAILEQYGDAHYIPIDVSDSVLEESATELESRYSNLIVEPIAARYEEGLAQIDADSVQPKLVLWLGGSIGNLSLEAAAAFLRDIFHDLTPKDQLLIGIDLLKDKAILEAAYNDAAGVTAEFNLNMLQRINNELDGDFNLQNFSHQAIFNEDEGRIEMYIQSETKQTVRIDELDMEVRFESGELIHTENSHKYTLEEIDALALRIGRQIKQQWLDSQSRFSLNLFAANRG